MPIPSQYLPIMPYLILPDSQGFLAFMKRVFNAGEQMIVPDKEGKISHGELRIGEAVIMFAEATETWAAKSSGMFMYVNNVNQIHQEALAAGSKELMAPEKKDYGYTSGFEDQWGNQWWVVEK